MSKFPAFGSWGLFNQSKGPWGSPGRGPKGEKGDDDGDKGPKGPWKPGIVGGNQNQAGNVSSLDDWLRKNRSRFGGSGGGGGGLSGLPNPGFLFWAVIGLVLIFLLSSMVHRITPGQRGVVTHFGSYEKTLPEGLQFTLPAPIANVEKVDIASIREVTLGTGSGEALMLTGDENIIDIEYQVRWNIRDPEQFLFQLADPETTISEVAESAMRQVIAQSSLQDAIGDGRSEIEAEVQQLMQDTLDQYQSGVRMQGVAIKQADPPAEVNEAFKDVTAAQQDAQSEINNANAYALQITARAQGEAEAFSRVYEEYRLAPEVTRRRMYYETMERVLQDVDKTIVEAPGVQPYLPLNELRRSQPAPSASNARQGGQ